MNTYRRNSFRSAFSFVGAGFFVFLWIFVIASWVTNLYKFTQCDFADPYKGEIIHGIGLFTPAFVVTAWIDAK